MYMLGIAMAHGHDPREAREYAWRDLELLTYMSHLIEQRQAFGGPFNG